MKYKIQMLNGFKLYFDQISNVFRSRYNGEEKINLDQLTEITGLNRRKTRIVLNFLADLGLSQKRTLNKTELGNIIYENDKYLEDKGTLWILHYLGSVNEEIVIWNKFMNYIADVDIFTPEEIMEVYEYLKEYVSEYTYKHHVRKELSTIIDGYINQRFSNLQIIDIEGEENKYRVLRNQDVPNLIFLAACIDFRDRKFNGATAVEITEICKAENSPGKILLLDEHVVRQKFEELKMNKLISIESRGDLDQIRLNEDIRVEDLINKYYKDGML